MPLLKTLLITCVKGRYSDPGAEWQPDISGVSSKAVLQGRKGFAGFLALGSPLPTLSFLVLARQQL